MSQVPPVVDVSYSVKELFEKVDRKLDRISDQLDGKADKAEVKAIDARLTAVEQFKWKLYGVALGAGLAGAGGSFGLLKAIGGI